MLPTFSLVLGGARSGKSAISEKLITETGLPRTYIATSEAYDAEMQVRIAQHQTDRGKGWHTVEAPRNLPEALADAPQDSAVLIDCATLWLSNLMLADIDPEPEIARLRTSIGKRVKPIVIVSNEVGMGIVPENALARRFRDLQGRFNREMAGDADLVLGVMAGLPFVLKGTMPGGAP